MNESKYKTFLIAAKKIGGEYAHGYKHGLMMLEKRLAFNELAHEKYMELSGDEKELGDGYRDGYAGKAPCDFDRNIGDLNAAGKVPADSQCYIKLNGQLKAAYVKAAKRSGVSLSVWILSVLDQHLKEHFN